MPRVQSGACLDEVAQAAPAERRRTEPLVLERERGARQRRHRSGQPEALVLEAERAVPRRPPLELEPERRPAPLP